MSSCPPSTRELVQFTRCALRLDAHPYSPIRALARLGGEIAHQVLIRIAQQIVTLGAVGAKVQRIKDRHQPRQAILHILAASQFCLIIEVRLVDHAFEVVCFRQPANNLVNRIANLLNCG